ncbi:hypothetical protein [Fodinicola feengrottensis]|nr:hypothetical protein [Fodinicola feengrottensis]
MCTAGLSTFPFLQKKNSGALAEDEAVALTVEGPGGVRRILVVR